MSIDYSSQVNTSTGGAVAAATVFAANGNRRGFFLQNQDTAALYFKFGPGCTTSVYDGVLKGGSGAHDGSGGATVGTLTVVYLAADKSQLDTVTKS